MKGLRCTSQQEYLVLLQMCAVLLQMCTIESILLLVLDLKNKKIFPKLAFSLF